MLLPSLFWSPCALGLAGSNMSPVPVGGRGCRLPRARDVVRVSDDSRARVRMRMAGRVAHSVFPFPAIFRTQKHEVAAASR
jgi:hypothetical protein